MDSEVLSPADLCTFEYSILASVLDEPASERGDFDIEREVLVDTVVNDDVRTSVD